MNVGVCSLDVRESTQSSPCALCVLAAVGEPLLLAQVSISIDIYIIIHSHALTNAEVSMHPKLYSALH